ncbi:MAG: acyl-CoA thioesterase [Desulfobacteraceae bacterium]|nr:MAG: acyl-CoA thioesterase [Desulfobacteraceae bacterium]
MNTVENPRFHICPIQIQVADTDYGGGVYHGRYLALYNQARDRFMDDMGVSYHSLMKRDIHLTIAETRCKFLRRVSYGETIHVHSTIQWYRNKSLGFYQKMVAMPHGADPLDKNEVWINAVCVSSGCAVEIPSDLIDAIVKWNGS